MRSVAALLPAVLITCACGSGVTSTPSPTLDLTVHTLATCTSAQHVPAAVSTVVPAADNPPTSVLRVGDAAAFVAPTGSRIGVVGTSDRPASSVVCQSARGSGTSRRAVILGLSPGFVQVALQLPGTKDVLRTLVTVTN